MAEVDLYDFDLNTVSDWLSLAVARMTAVCSWATEGTYEWCGGYESYDTDNLHFAGMFHPNVVCEDAPGSGGPTTGEPFLCYWCGSVIW